MGSGKRWPDDGRAAPARGGPERAWGLARYLPEPSPPEAEGEQLGQTGLAVTAIEVD